MVMLLQKTPPGRRLQNRRRGRQPVPSDACSPEATGIDDIMIRKLGRFDAIIHIDAVPRAGFCHAATLRE